MSGHLRALRLTARGWGLLGAGGAVLVVSTFANRREGLFVAAFLVLVVVASAVAARTQKPNVEVERRFSSETPAREPLDVTDIVQARASTSGVVGWSERVPDDWGTQPHGVLPAALSAAGRRAGIRYSVLPQKRGVFQLGPLRLRMQDPLGVAEAERPIGGVSTVTVLPRVSELHDVGLFGADGDGRQRERSYLAAPRVDELIAREYRSGDPIRRVHWRATARRGELMVRQEEPQGDPEAVLVLDLSPGLADESVESMVDLCASVAAHLAENGYRVTLVEAGSPRATSIAPSELPVLLTSLAVYEPVREAADAVDSARDALARVASPVPLFLFATGGDSAVRFASLVTLGRPAVAFVSEMTERTHDLSDEGWRVTGVAGPDDVSAAWNRVVFSTGGADDAVE